MFVLVLELFLLSSLQYVFTYFLNKQTNKHTLGLLMHPRINLVIANFGDKFAELNYH